ncbi:hypothetical protein GBAR_LOCUS23620 [Geodia barretti]|uniref:Uncharacterized protein n=1 Tax=Geodia barretti TaxID=519541 RepID=A0AA35T883_GEOBA|nr:hypothetical protein GBAR_LOCUS23620 [Geodia barretti]
MCKGCWLSVSVISRSAKYPTMWEYRRARMTSRKRSQCSKINTPLKNSSSQGTSQTIHVDYTHSRWPA